MNAEAVNDVTVTQCIFKDSIQAVSDWRGSGWRIHHNRIMGLRTACGGGIGVLVADFDGTPALDNLVSHNRVTGLLKVDPDDCGGYDGTGIVLFADFRFGRSGTGPIAENLVSHNKVRVLSDTPDLVDIVALELTDTRDDPLADPFPVIFANWIAHNDLRGSARGIELTPAELGDHNNISRNKTGGAPGSQGPSTLRHGSAILP
jgi:hypothetical protein